MTRKLVPMAFLAIMLVGNACGCRMWFSQDTGYMPSRHVIEHVSPAEAVAILSEVLKWAEGGSSPNRRWAWNVTQEGYTCNAVAFGFSNYSKVDVRFAQVASTTIDRVPDIGSSSVWYRLHLLSRQGDTLDTIVWCNSESRPESECKEAAESALDAIQVLVHCATRRNP